MAGRGAVIALIAVLAAVGAGGCAADVDLVPGDAAAVTGTGAIPVSAPSGSATGSSAPAGSSSPAGSPSPAGVLPAGGYDVLLTAVDATGRQLTVDVVDHLAGDAAVLACREDGGHGDGESCRDGYVRNTRSPVRTLPVAGTAAITMSPTASPRPATLAEVAAGLPTRNLYSLRVDGGQVAKLDEIHRP